MSQSKFIFFGDSSCIKLLKTSTHFENIAPQKGAKLSGNFLEKLILEIFQKDHSL